MTVVAPPPPPSFDLLPAGTRLVAGMGYATVLPDLDFETYSEAGFVWDAASRKWKSPPGASQNTKGLSVVGTYNYVAHPTFRLLSLAYDLKEGAGRRRWRPGLSDPKDLFEHVLAGRPLEAWNVAFERWVWELHCAPVLGWPAVQPHQWRCAMAKARAHSLPGALAKAGAVLGLKHQKDPDGDRLLKIFSIPQNPTQADDRLRVIPVPDETAMLAEWSNRAPAARTPGQQRKLWATINEEHVDTLKLYDYNETDILSEAEASSRTPDLEGMEAQWWSVHEDINRRGVQIDVQGVEDCIALIEQAHARYHSELFALTGIDAATKVQQITEWLRARGVLTYSLDEDAVIELLKRNDLIPEARRVLEIRAAVGSASVKKVFAMRNRMDSTGRLRDLYVYYGAHTGRSTGEGPQPTNLPKAGPDSLRCGLWWEGAFVEGSGCRRHFAQQRSHCPWCGQAKRTNNPVEWNPDAAVDALDAIRTRSLAWVEYVFGDAMGAVAGALRALFVAKPGHVLMSTDFNSIEAVGLAMLAGEQWRIEVFRTHGKIYEASAAMMYRVPFEDFATHRKAHGQHHPLRQKGKIGELAFGYQGWVGAAQAFGMPGSEDEVKADILAWRRASPAIEWFWGGQTLGKAVGIWENAGKPVSGVDRWDRSPHYFGVEGMFVRAMMEPGVEFPVKRLDGTQSGITFVMRGDAVYCRLLSGRYLTYHRPRFEHSDRGGTGLSFERWNSNPKNGPMGWIRVSTWGGRTVENINQAVCADVFRFACLNLERAGYPIVLHTYDEPVSEVPEGYGSIEEYERLCEIRPPWAADWPIKAPGGYVSRRYRKA